MYMKKVEMHSLSQPRALAPSHRQDMLSKHPTPIRSRSYKARIRHWRLHIEVFRNHALLLLT